MNKLDMESKDIVKDNLEYIRERFPEAVTEENGELKLNPDSLIQSLSSVIIDDKKEKYELTWPGKKQAIVEGNTRTTKTLRPLKDKSVDFDKTENIYIEGDNLEALKILQESYLNKIKCIYIDPPYNTGNDFIYNDNFDRTTKEELIESGQIDELGNRLVTNSTSNGRFHSDWLSMMYPRLKLARNLLSDDGVIFISIDDNEQSNLKKICDEIFGEENFIDTLMVELSITSGMKVGAAKEGTITKNGEFIHIYSKSSNWKNSPRIPLYDYVSGFDTHFSAYMKDDGTLCDLSEILVNNIDIVNEFEKYGIPSSKIGMKALSDVYDKSEIIHKFIIDNISKIAQPRSETPNLPEDIQLKNGYWTEYISDKRDEPYYLSCDENGKVIRLIPMSGHCKISDDFNPEFGRVVIRGDYWKGFWRDMVNVYKEGDTQYKNGKKPVRLIKQLLKWAVGNDPDAIIMDFFAGSSTTAHAVMQLNSLDSGNRKYIMVQIPEPVTENNSDNFQTLCEIGQSRIKKSLQQMSDENLVDRGFRVYKIDESNMKDEFYLTPDKVTQEQIKLFENNIKDDRTPEDLLTQVILNLGLKLDLPIEEKDMCGNKVFDIDDGELLACFDDNVNIDIIEKIAEIKPRQVVFRDSSFATDQDKVNFEERLKRLSAGTKFNVL